MYVSNRIGFLPQEVPEGNKLQRSPWEFWRLKCQNLVPYLLRSGQSKTHLYRDVSEGLGEKKL